MSYKVAVDFGTTNSVVAVWDADIQAPTVIHLPGLSTPVTGGELPLVPSLLYVHAPDQITLGHGVREAYLDRQQDNRLFRNFKRGIVALPAPDPRQIDDRSWSDEDAGTYFVRHLLRALPYPQNEIEQLALTAPVASFEHYLTWLNGVIGDISPDKVRIVDESTAAALGYRVTEPGAMVLVFDFGGGTLDLSLVQLPENREATGGFLGRLRRGKAQAATAKVIAKAGRILGGSDIDQWLLGYVLERTGVTIHELGAYYTALLTACELAKIRLSTEEAVELSFATSTQSHSLTVTRTDLETLLETNGFYTGLRHVVDKVMHIAQRRGIFREDIRYVLLVGGVSLIPSVQRALQDYFSGMAVRADKPFTAVAEGALQVAAGLGLEDYLAHSYGLRHLDPLSQQHAYDEIIPMGSRYPSHEPVEVLLGAAHDHQQSIEFVIAEIDSDSFSMLEVQYEDGQAVFVAQANSGQQQIIPVNPEQASQALARLIPDGQPGADRLRALFSINERRQLQLTVEDLQTHQMLLQNVTLATLR